MHEIICASEKAFPIAVAGTPSKHHTVSIQEKHQRTIGTTDQKTIFIQKSLHVLDLEHVMRTEDLHSRQLKKRITEKYITQLSLTYGKHYSEDILPKDAI